MEITQEAQAVRNIACVLLKAGAPSGIVEESSIHEAVNTAARTWATFHEAIPSNRGGRQADDSDTKLDSKPTV